jgi:hypothetical protein
MAKNAMKSGIEKSGIEMALCHNEQTAALLLKFGLDIDFSARPSA